MGVIFASEGGRPRRALVERADPDDPVVPFGTVGRSAVHDEVLPQNGSRRGQRLISRARRFSRGTVMLFVPF